MISKIAVSLIGLAFVAVAVFFVNLFGEHSVASPLLAATITGPLIFGLLFFYSVRFDPVVRFNLAATAVLVVVAVYGFESALQMGWYTPSARVRASEPGPAYDHRSLVTVVSDLKRQNKDAYPAVYPRGLFAYRDGQTLSALGDLLPLGGISDVETVACNETGEYLIYRSDERGFNNPQGLWDGNPVDVLAVGDSFTQGHCVGNGSNFVAKIRERFPRTLNLGMSANGPLAALGGLREYLSAVKPRIVLWFYFEENDVSEDLPIEELSPILAGYLNAGRTQTLIKRQPEIDAGIKRWLKTTQGNAPKPINAPPPEGQIGRLNLPDLLFLRTLRNRQNILLGPTRRHVALFERIMTEARTAVTAVGAQLYVVNLPGRRRFVNTAGRVSQELRRARVFAVLARLGIPVIDTIPAFAAHPNPASLFYSHYTEAGNAVVARETLRALEQDGTN